VLANPVFSSAFDLPALNQPGPLDAPTLERDAHQRATSAREHAKAALTRAQATLLRAEAAEKRTRRHTPSASN
jgi:hypothetical protein